MATYFLEDGVSIPSWIRKQQIRSHIW